MTSFTVLQVSRLEADITKLQGDSTDAAHKSGGRGVVGALQKLVAKSLHGALKQWRLWCTHEARAQTRRLRIRRRDHEEVTVNNREALTQTWRRRRDRLLLEIDTVRDASVDAMRHLEVGVLYLGNVICHIMQCNVM